MARVEDEEDDRARPLDGADGADADVGDESAAYISCVSRGDWWKSVNALGDVGPEGKRLDEEGVEDMAARSLWP